MTKETIGFIGIGNMGGPISKNLSDGGYHIVGYDIAGTAERVPEGATVGRNASDVATQSDIIMMSLPDGNVVQEVVEEIVATNDRRTATIIDVSTSGVAAARNANIRCRESEIEFYDAPVSGGVPGARAGTISIMFAGPEVAFERLRPVLEAFGKPFLVGNEPGQGQAMKILNNFLSATAMAATSEAVLYGLSEGLDMKTLLDVVNVSTGQNTATRDKFPDRILTETYDAGFKTALLAKDVRLYMDNVKAAKTPDTIGSLISGIWNDCDKTLPQSDFTRIFEYIRDKE